MADERDPKVSKRYRELASEEPPRELDQSILAAARRAHDRPHAPLVTPAGRHRWYYAFGAAAILVLAVAVTVQIERQRPDPEMVSDAPVPQARTEDFSLKAPPKPVDPPKAESGFTPDPAPKRQERAEDAKRDAASASSAPAAAPAESRSDENARGAAASRQEQKAEEPKPEARADPAPRPMAAPAARARMAEQAAESPERWLERIVQLRKEGRHEEAEKQLAEFRKRYPDYKVPEAALKGEK
jgi:hypothetical protein